MKTAMLWEPRDEGRVTCNLCHHRCLIAAGTFGLCGVRKNVAGTLYTLVYNRCIACHADPIEKKPLFHFLPASTAFSIATAGCNFHCLHCQNASISQIPLRDSTIPGEEMTPRTIVARAKAGGHRTIAYTYTEPTIFFEYAFDTAQLATEQALYNVFITNGYTTTEALDTIAPYLNAANIDLKFFKDSTYREVCGARLQPVLDTIRHYHDLGLWIELTTLVIPGYNDSDDELRAIAEFIADLDVDIPWHVSRFHPAYKMNHVPPTPVETIRRAWSIGKDTGLHYVYIGNMPSQEEDITRCPNCHIPVIKRGLFGVESNTLINGRCPGCDTEIAGIWGGG